VFYEVTRLRRHGQRLRQAELEPPLVGQLNMFQWEGKGNNSRRALRVIEVLVRVGSLMQPKGRMSEPAIIATHDDGTLVFAGIEIEARDGRVFEHHQVWRVRPAGAAEQTTPLQSPAAAGAARHGQDLRGHVPGSQAPAA
jgi:hypothetical protein